MFCLGAEWKGAVRNFDGVEIGECETLDDVPGMLRDLDVTGRIGFLNLSKDVAGEEGGVCASDSTQSDA